MGNIVDYNLTEEIAHGIYVSRLAREVARELGLSEREEKQVAYAGLLHDIGKLKLAGYLYADVRDERPLVVEELRYVRMHPLLSCQTLTGYGYDKDLIRIIRYHHENYDGSGYPEGLVGSEIPIGARIIRVCDVYSALTSDRPYRSRFSDEEAMALMIEDIRCFDLRVFLAFERVVHKAGTSFKVELPDSDEELCPALASRNKRSFVRYAKWQPAAGCSAKNSGIDNDSAARKRSNYGT